MTRNERRAIVFMALAMSGAQIPGLLNNPKPSRAECPDIGQVVRNYRPGALNEWAAQAGAEAREAMGGEVERRPYYEERPQAAVPHAVEQPQVQRPETTPMPPAAAPIAAPTTRIGADDGASTQTIWAKEQRSPTAAEQDEWNNLRNMGRLKIGQTAPTAVRPQQRRNVQL